jgi:multicomponent Na+:H+ antiporter subunit D
VEESEGTGAIDDVDGVLHRSPFIAVLFLPAALSLAGLPPFSGFVGKLALVGAGLDAGQWVIVGVSLGASILTLFSMTKIWGGVFWGTPAPGEPRRLRPAMLWPTAALVVAGIAIAIVAEPILGYAERAAADLLDPSGYRSLVLGMTP